MTNRKRLIYQGCIIAGFVVFLVLRAIVSAWYDNRQKLLGEQAEKVRRVEQERVQAERETKDAKLKAEMETLKIHCKELQDKVDADPRHSMLDSELSEAGREEVQVKRDVTYDCDKQYTALLKANPALVPPPEPVASVAFNIQQSMALQERDLTSQYLGTAAGDQMYECVIHGYNTLHMAPSRVEGISPLSDADIDSCNDLYRRVSSAIKRFNRGY
jgi:hypothetical protein